VINCLICILRQTERDFAEIAGAGLNWIRLPVPYWMIQNAADQEPFTAGAITYRYFLLALSWARKYGLRVNLDLHAIPGSQNGYNHSSKGGTANFLQGVMGYANYQRTRNYIRTLGELISTPQYENVVVIFSILNEPRPDYIGKDVLKAW
jgi:glucan 1,3-beta-glucosidase